MRFLLLPTSATVVCFLLGVTSAAPVPSAEPRNLPTTVHIAKRSVDSVVPNGVSASPGSSDSHTRPPERDDDIVLPRSDFILQIVRRKLGVLRTLWAAAHSEAHSFVPSDSYSDTLTVPKIEDPYLDGILHALEKGEQIEKVLLAGRTGKNGGSNLKNLDLEFEAAYLYVTEKAPKEDLNVALANSVDKVNA